MNRKKGFTLVEVIVVLVILAILAGIFIPAMIGYIGKAEKKKIIGECRLSVVAAQVISSDNHLANIKNIDLNEVKKLAEIKGDILSITVEKDSVIHLTYKNNGYTCVYCKDIKTCGQDPKHLEKYTVTKSKTDAEAPENDDENIYIGGDPANKIEIMGALTFPLKGERVPKPWEVYANDGKYYALHDAPKPGDSEDVNTYLNKNGIEIDISAYKSASSSTKNGDLRKNGNEVQVFYGGESSDNRNWHVIYTIK